MPPRKSKTASLFAEAAKFLESVNAEVPTVDWDAIEDRDYRSTDGLVLFAHFPESFKPGTCGECGAIYAVNRNAVGFCSDPCRRDNWVKTTGVPWRAVSVHDVWDGNPPNIINREQLSKLAAIAEWFNTNRTVLDTLAETESEPEQQEPELDFLSSSLEDEPESLLRDQFRTLDPAIFRGELDWQSDQEDHERNPPTNPQHEPSHAVLELTAEEVSLFDF